jgi:hypothetical protein
MSIHRKPRRNVDLSRRNGRRCIPQDGAPSLVLQRGTPPAVLTRQKLDLCEVLTRQNYFVVADRPRPPRKFPVLTRQYRLQ